MSSSGVRRMTRSKFVEVLRYLVDDQIGAMRLANRDVELSVAAENEKSVAAKRESEPRGRSHSSTRGAHCRPLDSRLASLRPGVVVILKSAKIRTLTQRRLWA